MSTDNKKILMLNSSFKIETKDVNSWECVAEKSVGSFIQGIETSKGEGGEDAKGKFRAVISGIPSPWARVLITRESVYSEKKDDLKASVLDNCYRLLKSEWRGLIAAYVLRPDRFELSDPLALIGKNVNEYYGNMSVRYMYGEMLFNETPLWVYADDVIEDNKKNNPPYIQILYYKRTDGKGRIPVAATSPYTLFFTSVNYNLAEAKQNGVISWIDGDGKFTEPYSTNYDESDLDDLQRLYSFLDMMIKNLSSGESDDETQKTSYLDWMRSVIAKNRNKYRFSEDTIENNMKSWSAELGRWKSELGDKIQKLGKVPDGNIPLFNVKPQGPLAILMNSEHKFYYLSSGKISNKNIDHENSAEILSSEIFIESDYIAAWDNDVQNGKDHSKSTAYYVIPKDNMKYAFPLPFTSKALSVFENRLAEIVYPGPDSMIKLSAEVKGNMVEFVLRADLDGNSDTPICKKSYQMSMIPETAGKVFIWPNFYSRQWKKYYYYSEFPSNVTGVRMIPRFDDIDFNDASSEQKKKYYLVMFPVDKAVSGSFKYEIIRSEKPLNSIYIKLYKNGDEVNGGVLVVKRLIAEPSDNRNSSDEKRNIQNEYAFLKEEQMNDLKNARVGIDFGSTNTCAYYSYDGNEEPIPVPFTNRRMAVVGFDSEPHALAGKDELLFISNEGTAFPNGQVKSWLHLHSSQYTKDGANLAKEIAGGVPVNERNVVVRSMNEYVIQTNAGELHYNMKWLPDSGLRKESFIRMLWLQICADMAAAKFRPNELRWSFPSSMTSQDIDSLNEIYDKLNTSDCSPYTGTQEMTVDSYTEAEADYTYSKFNLNGDDVLGLGIDVGGSTSDIFIARSVANNPVFAAQSSIRMAAGFFFKAINSSAKFREALYNFHDSHVTNVSVRNIQDVVSEDPEVYKRSPYYLNSVLDQLSGDEDFRNFYSSIRSEVPTIFAFPAYVTGVLMFYSGMLVRKVVEQNKLENIRQVEMHYYGKGGRLFEWLLDTFNNKGKFYYAECFKAGYGDSDVELSIGAEDKLNNKSEVSIGLVNGPQINVEKDGKGNRIIERCDVIGEKGVKDIVSQQELSDVDTVDNSMFDGGINIEIPKRLENFNRFMDIFIAFVSVDTNILKDVSALLEGKEHLRLLAFIQNDPEYIKCHNAYDSKAPNRPIYRMPLFIASALCYMNDVLLPVVSSKMK